MRLIKLLSILFVLCPSTLFGQPTAIDSLAMFHEAMALNSGKVQQEMIYLHLDNTSYYRGDRIFFAGYLVQSGDLKPSGLSRTAYVELLNPNGKVIDHCILKTIDGRFHGSLTVEEKPFYSGYYEVRAYTRYMLNFGSDAVFSRVIPVFDSPTEVGNWADRKMLEYGSPKLEFNRPKPRKTKEVNIKLYPEGGRLVNGLFAKVAFEITNNQGRPLAAEGRMVNIENNSEITTFKSGHMGRGTFEFMPTIDNQYIVVFTVNGKNYKVPLPKILPQGISLSVDNLTNSDSLKVTVRSSPEFPYKVVGTSLTCRNEIYGRFILDMQESDSTIFSIPKRHIPTGVNLLTVFDTKGHILADRMFFNNLNDFVEIDCEFNKSEYSPLEPVELTIKYSDNTSQLPYTGHLSLSVTDATENVAYGSNILSELLLSSEIRGYIHDPSWYFADSNDSERSQSLDQLLMIQGWHRYSWSQLAGLESFSIDSVPEKGIEVHGQVLQRLKNKPIQGVTISAMLTKVPTDSTTQRTTHIDTFTTDSNGRFAFRSYIKGNYMMTLSTSKNGKIKPYRIILNANENPGVRVYEPGEMQVILFKSPAPHTTLDTIQQQELNTSNIKSKGILLKEVAVTAKAAPWELGQMIENSQVSYDIEVAHDKLLDNGTKFIRTLKDLLPMIDSHFCYNASLTYRGRQVIFVLDSGLGNNKVSVGKYRSFLIPEDLPVETIKNVYVSTDDEVIFEQICRRSPGMSLDQKFEARRNTGCVVYVELYKQLRVKPHSGVRRTILEGYSTVEEFYSPDYSSEPPIETDYRRTLYWNPDVIIDSDSTTTIRFFNNSTATHFQISTATVTPFGSLGGQ